MSGVDRSWWEVDGADAGAGAASRASRAAAELPVYSPLIGFEKNEIIGLAREIGTYEISILPHEDCCSFLVARHPETKADRGAVEALDRFEKEAPWSVRGWISFPTTNPIFLNTASKPLDNLKEVG